MPHTRQTHPPTGSPRRRRALVLTALVVPLVAGTASAVVQTAPADAATAAACPWQNTRLSPDQRTTLLLDASSLGQKLRWLNEQAANNPTQTTFSGVVYPVQLPCTPQVTYSDGPDYVRGATGVTVFPAQIALASAWNGSLAQTKGAAQADEAFRSGRNVLLAPGISSGRTPLAGRTPEYFGEDPLLSGTLAAAQVNGIQQSSTGRPVMAVLKHYVANEQELDRQTSSSNIDGRTLREVYDLPFQIAIAGSDPGGVMCSFNQVNNVYACENPIQKTLLKDQQNWPGYVVTDFGSQHSTGPSLVSGLDQELNRPKFFTPALVGAALDNGTITMADVDEAARRVIRAYIANGLFDHPLPASPSTSSSTVAHKAVSQQIAEQGSVLLKNDGNVLPLAPGAKSVALIGQTVSNTPTADGVSAGTVCAEGGSGGFGAGRPTCLNPVAPLDAFTARARTAGGSVTYNDGTDTAAAATTAASADTAVVFVRQKIGEFADATSLSLDGNGDALISAVAAANPNTVVVLETGSAVAMPWLSQVKGVVEAWYPGDQQGNALARLLYGDVDFTGRLPMTFPASLADTPTSTPAQYPGVFADGSTTRPAGDTTSIRQVSYSEGLAVGYKWYDSKNIAPLFPFGYGLSYTSFKYTQLQTSPIDGNVRNGFTASARVTNTGSKAGTATPQAYLTLPAPTGEPGKRLVGFGQVTLLPGQSATVQIKVDASSAAKPLSYYDTNAHAWTTAAGSYALAIGSSSRNIALTKGFVVR